MTTCTRLLPLAIASSRWAARPILPPSPVIAAMWSIHTNVGWFAIALPPSAVAFADHSGFTYTDAPAYGLSTWPAAYADGVASIDAAAAAAASDPALTAAIVRRRFSAFMTLLSDGD